MSSESDKVVAEETASSPETTELIEATPSQRPTKAPRARAKTKSASTSGPKSRRMPVASKVAPKSSKSAPPRSRRAAARSEVSIPPISTDLDVEGHAIAADEVTAMTPTPPPTAVTVTSESRVTTASTDDALDLAAFPLTRPVMSPVVKVGLALAAAACLLFAGRGLIRHRAPPVVDATASLSVAAVAPAITATVVEETIIPSSDTLAPESADEDKAASLAALEQGKIEEAIAAGERATKIDPTDADTWRVLGAAYQDQGNVIAARRCYRACVDSAKRGDTRECALLLQ